MNLGYKHADNPGKNRTGWNVEKAMATCDTCGNDYEETFTVTRGNQSGTFDSFECAIHAMAPTCDHCGCRILGHGVKAGGATYCCAHCARESGHANATDRV